MSTILEQIELNLIIKDKFYIRAKTSLLKVL